jgi:hypothetical protein
VAVLDVRAEAPHGPPLLVPIVGYVQGRLHSVFSKKRNDWLRRFEVGPGVQ